MTSAGWATFLPVKTSTIQSVLRAVVTLNLVVSSTVLFSLLQPEDAPEASAAAVVTTTATQTSPAPMRMMLFQPRQGPSLVESLLVASPEPPPVEPPEENPAVETVMDVLAEADAGWTPPVWFPEDSQADLWVLDGMNGVPEQTDKLRGLRSRAAFVYDLDSGRVLLDYAADDRRPVASLTKLVSALAVVSDNAELEREVCLDRSMLPSWPGAGSRMKYGRCTTGWDLLGAALVRSDNGAALALPAITDLPLAPFVGRMNDVSADLQMDMSSFADPSGVQDDNLSTAKDMTRAVVAVAAHPVLAPVASAPYWDVEYSHGARRRMGTTNRLLFQRGIDVLAGKTGYTDTAGYCFTAVIRTASGRTLAITTLGARRGRYRWSDVANLISWAERQ